MAKNQLNADRAAFPISMGSFSSLGLTKREYFAAMALQGLCVPCIKGQHNGNNPSEAAFKAQMAKNLADALIIELDRTEKDET